MKVDLKQVEEACKELYIRAHLGKVKSQEEMQAALKALPMADLREFFPHGAGPAKQEERT